MSTKVDQVQGLRRSNAAQPIPSKKIKKQTTRRGKRDAAIRDSAR